MQAAAPSTLPGVGNIIGMFTQAGPWAILAVFMVYQMTTQGQYYERLLTDQHMRMAETQVQILQQQSDIAKTLERINLKLDTR